MKTFCKVLLTGALALGGLTVMNIDTPKAHADEWDGCHYICGPGETVNGVTVQVHSTQVTFGNSVIARITNDRAEEIHYNVSLEKKYGDDIYEDGTYRYKVEIKGADGSIDTIYTAGMTVTGR
ncbi:TPA: hypothetical protein ACR3Z0_003209 [Bacillus thuringiensis]|uniref:Uncharacterized protein n=1 Tax=Bacillus thuringiensis TaxID=1428 RepID=A0A9X6KT10_BACTU|nr:MULTISPECIES: hypothetical protein [Bacillus cereus group]AJA18781.1 signal peptide protein [Bacillus thuringiensis serovar galleriae]ETE90233.1 signal peptide protein [Bacillus thuringiensis serovar aizawai str. Leapi01]ETE98562.1 signal peptide protein [Bacillus thuringiensis serovar aizawai str. Hu4-2]KAB1378704.1 hypothetical protein FPG93_16770 [Bacillus thuringiensis]KLA22914.1 hypothetical protein B4158_1267 [Bacillus cereus]